MMDYEKWQNDYDIRQQECFKEWENDLKCQDFWRRFLDIIKEKDLYYRIKEIWDDEITQWDGLIEPVECCIEGWSEPVAKWDVDWIEVDPITEEKVGNGLPNDWVDYTEYLCEKLAAEGIEFSIVNHYIRIPCLVPAIARIMAIDWEPYKREVMYRYFWHPTLAEIFMEKVRSYRVKTIGSDEISQWGWLVIREDFHIESEWHEPVPMWEVEWIEIDPIIEEEIAPDLPTEWVNDTDFLCGKLRSKGADFSIVNKYIRVKIIPRR